LRGHARFLQPRIRGHKANLIDADSLRAGEGGLQLRRQLGRFGFSGWKGTDETRQLIARYGGEELYACQAGSGQQLCKLFFGRRAFQRHAIEQKLGTRRA
jgi:hypothetical protein